MDEINLETIKTHSSSQINAPPLRSPRDELRPGIRTPSETLPSDRVVTSLERCRSRVRSARERVQRGKFPLTMRGAANGEKRKLLSNGQKRHGSSCTTLAAKDERRIACPCKNGRRAALPGSATESRRDSSVSLLSGAGMRPLERETKMIQSRVTKTNDFNCRAN